MPGLAHRNEQFSDVSSGVYSVSSDGFWSKHGGDVSYNQLHKFWSELSLQAQLKLLQIDKKTLFEQVRKNMYCSRCNGLLLEGFLQIVMYGKSLHHEGVCNRSGASKNQNHEELYMINGCQDEIQDPAVHPWGGLTTTRDGALTLLNCYLYSKSLKGLQNVFDSARARERERELLYPDACGGGGRGWISKGITSYGRGHGTRETCALHTARLSCDTLVDFWSALGEETRQSLLKMKEEDFIERLMYRFESKRFCRDCRRNVIREFKELKDLKRMRREPRCNSYFCVADTAFQYEVSDNTIMADWRQTFSDTAISYHHFEWAVGTGEGKSDIIEFENVGLKGSVQVNGLDLGGLTSCFITLRAWKLDGRCAEFSVKAHALRGQPCVHCRLVVGDGFVSITRGESIRRFFEHAEEAEEEEDDDSLDKDGNELDGECSRPQKHAKSPELAREFLLDAATVIFKEQVEKAFREGTARQNAHSIFVCLALKLLEERLHVACKDIITLEKQMKLLEEEEKEKREEEERKEKRRTKEREKKLRRKERLKGKEKDKYKNCPELTDNLQESKDDTSACVDDEPNNAIICRDPVPETDEISTSRPGSPDNQEQVSNPDGDFVYGKYEFDSFTSERSKFFHQRPKFRKEAPLDASVKWSGRRRLTAVSENGSRESRHYSDNFDTVSRGTNGSHRSSRTIGSKSNGRYSGHKFNEKFHCPKNRMHGGFDLHSCNYQQNIEYRPKCKSMMTIDSANKDSVHSRKVWEATESQKKHPRSSSDSNVTLRSSSFKSEEAEFDGKVSKASGEIIVSEQNGQSVEVNGPCNPKEASFVEENSCPAKTSDPTGSSNSDNCSSCLSEGDSITVLSNNENLESLSTSDSEDTSQLSEGRETLSCQNGFPDSCDAVIENKPGEAYGNRKLGFSADEPRITDAGNVPCKPSLNGISSIAVGSQHQGVLPPLHNRNPQFPVFAAPSVNYYHQTPVAWPATQPNGLMPFPHHSHYLYAAPFNYGNSRLCMQYGQMQHLETPMYNPSHFPVYQQAVKADVLNLEERAKTEKKATANPGLTEVPSRMEGGKKNNVAKLHSSDSDFSLFHFGGPLALSKDGKVGDLSAKLSVDQVEIDHACNKKEAVMEEYNLFAASNGLRFSIF